MKRKRQIAVAGALAVVGLTGVALTARSVFFSGQQTFPAAARTARNIDLNFQKPGQVTVVNVKPGDYVHAGTELARIDDVGAKLEMNTAQAVLDLDQALFGLLQAPPPTASVADLQLAVQQAQQQLSSDQLNLSDVDAASQAAYARAQIAAANAQTALSGDVQLHSQACASLQNLECARLAAQLARDQASVSSADQGVVDTRQVAQQAHDRAQRALVAAQTGVSIAQARLGLKSGPAPPDRIQNIQATVQKDQAQLALSRQHLQQYLLVAPSNGLVVEVNGEVGDLVSDAGVRNFAPPPPVVPAQPGFQLYGVRPTQSAASGGYSSFVRLADTTQWQMVAQVPEAAVPTLKAGLPASITFTALPGHVTGHLNAVIPAPFTVSDAVYYRVVFTLEHPPNKLIPGMTGNVTVSLG